MRDHTEEGMPHRLLCQVELEGLRSQLHDLYRDLHHLRSVWA